MSERYRNLQSSLNQLSQFKSISVQYLDLVSVFVFLLESDEQVLSEHWLCSYHISANNDQPRNILFVINRFSHNKVCDFRQVFVFRSQLLQN